MTTKRKTRVPPGGYTRKEFRESGRGVLSPYNPARGGGNTGRGGEIFAWCLLGTMILVAAFLAYAAWYQL